MITRPVREKEKKRETDTYIKFSGFMHWSVVAGEREELIYYNGRYYVSYSQENREYEEKIEKLTCIVDKDMLRELIEMIKEQAYNIGRTKNSIGTRNSC